MNGGEVFFVAIDQSDRAAAVVGFSSRWGDGAEHGVSVYFCKANGFEADGEPVLLPGMQLLVVPMGKTIGG